MATTYVKGYEAKTWEEGEVIEADEMNALEEGVEDSMTRACDTKSIYTAGYIGNSAGTRIQFIIPYCNYHAGTPSISLDTVVIKQGGASIDISGDFEVEYCQYTLNSMFVIYILMNEASSELTALAPVGIQLTITIS